MRFFKLFACAAFLFAAACGRGETPSGREVSADAVADGAGGGAAAEAQAGAQTETERGSRDLGEMEAALDAMLEEEVDPALQDEILGERDENQPTIEEMRERALAEIDDEACKAGGGEVRQEGMLGMPRCVTPYPDAGELCRDSGDCAGLCLADDSVTDYDSEPGTLSGACQANDSPFGCYAEISDGELQPALCVD